MISSWPYETPPPHLERFNSRSRNPGVACDLHLPLLSCVCLFFFFLAHPLMHSLLFVHLFPLWLPLPVASCPPPPPLLFSPHFPVCYPGRVTGRLCVQSAAALQHGSSCSLMTLGWGGEGRGGGGADKKLQVGWIGLVPVKKRGKKISCAHCSMSPLLFVHLHKPH